MCPPIFLELQRVSKKRCPVPPPPHIESPAVPPAEALLAGQNEIAKLEVDARPINSRVSSGINPGYLKLAQDRVLRNYLATTV